MCKNTSEEFYLIPLLILGCNFILFYFNTSYYYSIIRLLNVDRILSNKSRVMDLTM